jgi:hypothetical protein
MLIRAEVEALRSCLVRAPEPGNMGRPNAVGAFFARWQRWQAEAHELATQLERALIEQPAVTPAEASQRTVGGAGGHAESRAAVLVFPRRPSPAEVHDVVAAITAECGRAPSGPELVAALRAQSGCSRASAYRALRPVRGPGRPGRVSPGTGSQ